MAIKKVWLDESNDICIACGLCEGLCPDVFEVHDKMKVKPLMDYTKFEKEIHEAVETCPSGVIKAE
jgi:ferredoxin